MSNHVDRVGVGSVQGGDGGVVKAGGVEVGRGGGHKSGVLLGVFWELRGAARGHPPTLLCGHTALG